MSTMTSPYKHPNSGIYYFRQTVPKSLRLIIGKSEFKASLRTSMLVQLYDRTLCGSVLDAN